MGPTARPAGDPAPTIPTASASRCLGVVEACTASITPVLPRMNPLRHLKASAIHGVVDRAQPAKITASMAALRTMISFRL